MNISTKAFFAVGGLIFLLRKVRSGAVSGESVEVSTSHTMPLEKFAPQNRMELKRAVDECIMTIAIGSKNPVKLRSGKLGMESVLSKEVRVEGFAAESGVPDQPVGEAETHRGAANRAKAAWRMYREAHGGAEPNYSIGMEGGINSLDEDDTMTCFAYIVIYNGNKLGKAKTATFDLPEAMARLVRGGMELGDADDQVMGRVNSKQGEGTVGALTRGLISRTDYYVPAVQLAYCVFNFPELYE